MRVLSDNCRANPNDQRSVYGLRKLPSNATICESGKLVAVACIGRCSHQLENPRPLFEAWLASVTPLGGEVAEPKEIN
jgi:hypothetical protein